MLDRGSVQHPCRRRKCMMIVCLISSCTSTRVSKSCAGAAQHRACSRRVPGSHPGTCSTKDCRSTEYVYVVGSQKRVLASRSDECSWHGRRSRARRSGRPAEQAMIFHREGMEGFPRGIVQAAGAVCRRETFHPSHTPCAAF